MENIKAIDKAWDDMENLPKIDVKRSIEYSLLLSKIYHRMSIVLNNTYIR